MMPKKVDKKDVEVRPNRGIGGRGGKSPKASGTYFENVAEDFFDGIENVSAKRIVGSGAFGTISREPRLMGDVYINWAALDKPILAEAKFGYSGGGKTQVTLKKEWFDKISEEARLAGRYPVVVFRFKGTRGPNANIIAMSWETAKEIAEYLNDKINNLERLVEVHCADN